MNIQNEEQWSQAFFKACSEGCLEDVKLLCQKKYLDLGWADIHARNDEGFRWACYSGQLDVVKYLLTSPELIEAGHTFADLHAKEDEGFGLACRLGHLDIVRYLLISKELKAAGHTFADLHANDELGFRSACYHGRLDIVKYLLTSPDLIAAGHSFSDLHVENERGFRLACSNGRWDVARWLVMDHGIEKTPAIGKMIQDYPQAQEYFRVREELQEIQLFIQETSNLNPYPSSIETHDADQRTTKKSKKL